MKSLQNLWSNNGRFTWSILPKRYIKSWVKKCLTKSWHMYLIKFWQIYLNKSWQQCYIKSWLIYLTAMLYQILAKIHHIRTRLMSCAKSERRGQKLVTCDLTKEEKCEQDVFFKFKANGTQYLSARHLCNSDWLTDLCNRDCFLQTPVYFLRKAAKKAT